MSQDSPFERSQVIELINAESGEDLEILTNIKEEENMLKFKTRNDEKWIGILNFMFCKV